MIVRESMDVRESDVIRDGETKYRIVENNARAVAATYVRTDPPDAPMAVGTLVIEKGTGDFAISIMVPGSPISTKVVTGKCQKEN
jgi:hypothetical protein